MASGRAISCAGLSVGTSGALVGGVPLPSTTTALGGAFPESGWDRLGTNCTGIVPRIRRFACFRTSASSGRKFLGATIVIIRVPYQLQHMWCGTADEARQHRGRYSPLVCEFDMLCAVSACSLETIQADDDVAELGGVKGPAQLLAFLHYTLAAQRLRRGAQDLGNVVDAEDLQVGEFLGDGGNVGLGDRPVVPVEAAAHTEDGEHVPRIAFYLDHAGAGTVARVPGVQPSDAAEHLPVHLSPHLLDHLDALGVCDPHLTCGDQGLDQLLELLRPVGAGDLLVDGLVLDLLTVECQDLTDTVQLACPVPVLDLTGHQLQVHIQIGRAHV